MKKNFAIYCFFFAGITSTSQINAQEGGPQDRFISNTSEFINSKTGKPLTMGRTYIVSGSQFYPNIHTPASVYAQDGKQIADIKGRINLPDYSLLFLNRDSTEMISTSPIDKVVFHTENEGDKVFRLYSSFPNTDEKKYYEVLDNGKAQLLKLYISDKTDKTELHSASVDRTFETLYNYYGYNGKKQLVELKHLEDIMYLFLDKRKEMSAYLKKEKINRKKEADLVKLFAYYNSL